MTNVLIGRNLLADLLSHDREKRIPAERHLYAILASPAPEVEAVEVLKTRRVCHCCVSQSREYECGICDQPSVALAQHNRIISNMQWVKK